MILNMFDLLKENICLPLLNSFLAPDQHLLTWNIRNHFSRWAPQCCHHCGTYAVIIIHIHKSFTDSSPEMKYGFNHVFSWNVNMPLKMFYVFTRWENIQLITKKDTNSFITRNHRLDFIRFCYTAATTTSPSPGQMILADRHRRRQFVP